MGVVPHCGHLCMQLEHTFASELNQLHLECPSAQEPTQKSVALPGRTFLEPLLGVSQAPVTSCAL